jgi:zinc transport system substrate-binding protein
LVDQIGGESVLVESLVAPGHDPHAYDPQPSQLRRFSEADIFFRSGLPFEATWLPRLMTLNPNLRVVDLREQLPIVISASEVAVHRHQDAHDHGIEGDPHIWTAPANIISMLEQISAVLSESAPAQAAFFANNRAQAVAEFNAIDARLRAQLADLSQRRFVVFHPAWGYLAEAYALEQIAIEKDEKEPGPRRIAELIEQMRAMEISMIVVQPQFDRRIASTIANAVAAQLVEIDPLAYDIGPQLLDFGQALETYNAR